MTHIFMKDTQVDSHFFMHGQDAGAQAKDSTYSLGRIFGGYLMNKATQASYLSVQ
jgi:hypothetical protein